MTAIDGAQLVIQIIILVLFIISGIEVGPRILMFLLFACAGTFSQIFNVILLLF